MISMTERKYIEEYAYLPDHVPLYVTAISRREPSLFGNYIVYTRKDDLVFVGYPLERPFVEKEMIKALDDALKRLRATEVRLIAPETPARLDGYGHVPSDYYYRLDLSFVSVSQEVRNMLNRASRDLLVDKTRSFETEHREMVDEFLKEHSVDEGTRFIFERIGDYVSSSMTAQVFDARRKTGELAAFDVIESGSKEYCFYMFNFRSKNLYIPGASDLLLSNVIVSSREEGKKYINLGLGINPGVTFFKRKWGGIPFVSYREFLYRPARKETMETLFQKL